MVKITKNVLMSFALLSCVFVTHWVKAQEKFLCDATQASTQELPTLDKNCPIGEGLWGKSQPRSQNSMFWIQCGIFSQPMPLADAKILYRQISTDVWMKPGAKQYRCLIGPYKDIRQARQELNKVRQLKGYHEAFIREVRQPQQATPVARAATPPQSSVTQRQVRDPQPRTAPQPATPPQSSPPPTAQTSNRTAPPPRPTTPTTAAGIEIRKQTVIAGVKYVIPFMGVKSSQFYMEYEIPWNRLDYDQAYAICQKIGMKMATESQWKQLLASQIMNRDQWPLYLPYWGIDKRGMFTSGKVSQLKGSSLLNVVCVQ
ncbi:SPOR domain-containing protein [Vibrio rhizosphaerae]|uniref:SPOR domain-containing protein n=1 Tax=Vibrio rhizosphaerae TaxID=398736 RepID=A0ABU4IQ01_9VIBR|nr:SPOR domain-containing protein [Vibrio rhizosphaerae]MDW6091477.1 SPOR domain-containing protein [Vibrio rhizosphaerae]